MKTKLLLLFFLPIMCFSQTQVGDVILGLSTVHSFGESVAISADGTIVAAGAPGTGNDSYVRVLKNENGTWTQVGSDIQNISILERVGSSVAMSANGSIVAVGARQAGDLDKGHVRIYKNLNNVWTQIGNDIIGDANFDEAGSSVVMSHDGNIVAIGSPLSDVNGSKSGKVKVYKNQNDTWVQVGADILGEVANDEFGNALDMSADGSIIAIGSAFNSANKGQIKIFRNENNTWTQLGSTISGEVGGDYLGYSLSLSDDGFTLASHDARGNNANPQHLRVFKYNNSNWEIKGSIISIDKLSSIRGSVSLSLNGNRLAYSDPSKKKASMYEFQNNSWVLKGTITKSTGFGNTTALSSDGSILAVGWKTAGHSGQNNVGAVFVYDNTSVLKTDNFIINSIRIYPNPLKNKLQVRLSNSLEFKYLEVFNILGKNILKSNLTNLDLNELPKGIYFLKIFTNKGSLTKKIIKN